MTRVPTLGVLAGWLAGEYQSVVFDGLVEAAREYDVNLVFYDVCIRGRPFRPGEPHNVVYDLARSETVDGLVFLAPTLGNNKDIEDTVRYFEHYSPRRPMCAIAGRLEGVTGILVDGEQALRDGIRHLIEQHPYRRIAFIAGPEDNPEANDRLRIYRDVMTSHGLPAPDSFVVKGDFRYEGGMNAVRVLLDERGLAFDAIVAANDQMALGTVDALRVREILVPRDVAIIGFDDIGEARFCVPPLTTIRQPILQQGRLAVEVLLQRLRGEQVDDVLVLPAELVVRRSCGCNSDVGRVSVTGTLPLDAELTLRRPRIVEVIKEAASESPARLEEGWEDRLFDALLAELKGSSDPIESSPADHPLQQTHVQVWESLEDAQAQHRLAIEQRTQALAESAEMLSGVLDFESLEAALRGSLARFGIPSFYLVLNEDISSDRARVLFAYDPARDPAILDTLRDAKVTATSPPDGLLPVDRSRAVVVEPLFFLDDPLGYAVFEMGPPDAFAYDALRVRICGALKVALLIEELQVRAGQLRQAQKMETLGQLSGAIAHDFNNLLQAIRGYGELARADAPGNAELAADLDEIVRASDRASQVTRQLLTFSQPTRANARVVSVNQCVEQAIPMIRHLLGPTIQLAAVLRPDAGQVLIDPAQLEQVIVNLCVNGRDAMPDGGQLTIETGRRLVPPRLPSGQSRPGPAHLATRPLAAQAQTYVEVHDTGVGIAPEIRNRIFEPFFTTKEAGHGTGLGLSIVYGIVRNASGDISLESEPGGGTRFSIMFPTAEDAKDAAAAGVAPPARGCETVLLVEDEDAIRKLAERVLTSHGYRVLSASNAAAARDVWFANEGRVDLLLSDVTMPGMSGVAFAAELAGHAQPPRTLFISGMLSGEGTGPALPAGARFLPKPFSVAALLDTVRATLDLPTTIGDD